LGAANPQNGNTNYVEVVVSQPQPTYFAGILRIESVLTKTRAEAVGAGETNCMFALDPTAAGALTVAHLAAVYSPKCGVVDESTSSSALSCGLFASITASQIGVVGGASSLLCSISPKAKTGISSPGDPLAYLPTPTVPSCGTTKGSPLFWLSVSTEYNGQFGRRSALSRRLLWRDYHRIGRNVTFMAGIYVLTSWNGTKTISPGGPTIDLGATRSGSGVTFCNYGSSCNASCGGINFKFTSFTSGGVNLTAPTSGTYSGILFFQDPQNTSTSTIVGSSSWNTVLQGAYYFPNAQVQFALDGIVACSILVAKDIDFLLLTVAGSTAQSGANNNNNFSSLANGSPAYGSGAVLVE
jgi:hypothetical protein